MAKTLPGKTALVTGASRGVGAKVAELLAQEGADVAINYRSKRLRAETVAEAVRQRGQKAFLSQADITNQADVARMMEEIKEAFGQLNYLILNASGGLEKDKPEDYAMRLNRDAQTQVLDAAKPLLVEGSRVVFVTSHLAHFYGQRAVYDVYEPVAKSKKAGEDALREAIPELSKKGVSLVVVSGDMIEGTITPKLMERSSRGVIEARRDEAGYLPTVTDFAEAIVKASYDERLKSGDTVFIGSTD